MNKVYIIHGWSYSLDKWDPARLELQRLNIEPVFLKVPGLTVPSPKEWDMESYISWLNNELSGIEKPVVVGHSNGGRIAASYLERYPNAFSKLILVDSAGVAHNEFKSVAKLKILKVLSKVGKVFSYIPIVKKVFYKLIGAQDYVNASPNMKLTMRNMLDSDRNLDFSKITVPTTIIWGREDKITPLKDGKTINSKIVGSKLVVIDGARHSPFYNHSEEVAKLIAAVLNT